MPCPMLSLKAVQRRMWLAGAKSLVPQARCVLDLSRDLAGCLLLPIFPMQRRAPDFVPYARSKIRFTFLSSLKNEKQNESVVFFL